MNESAGVPSSNSDDATSRAAQPLEEVAKHLRAGGTSPVWTIRELLQQSQGAFRRGAGVVRRVKAKLTEVGLTTDPDFETPHIDHELRFSLLSDNASDGAAERESPKAAASPPEEGEVPEDRIAATSRDPMFKVRRLRTAEIAPTFVQPQTTLARAATIMLSRDYSQLPVGNNLRSIKGVVSWKSIGARLALGSVEASVDGCIEPAAIIDGFESVFAAIPIIAENQYVLVRGSARSITGIITSTDLSIEFQRLTEPFLLIQETELYLRKVVEEQLTLAELVAARDVDDAGREVSSVDDLTFGELHRLLCNPDVFSRTNLPVDRLEFTRALDEVRKVRNDVMHFNTDALAEPQLKTMRDFARFLRKLDRLLPRAGVNRGARE